MLTMLLVVEHSYRLHEFMTFWVQQLPTGRHAHTYRVHSVVRSKVECSCIEKFLSGSFHGMILHLDKVDWNTASPALHINKCYCTVSHTAWPLQAFFSMLTTVCALKSKGSMVKMCNLYSSSWNSIWEPRRQKSYGWGSSTKWTESQSRWPTLLVTFVWPCRLRLPLCLLSTPTATPDHSFTDRRRRKVVSPGLHYMSLGLL